MFGVGGGFLTTPLLIVYGIPPTVAAASAASQVTGASVSGVFAHFRRDGVDFKMGGVLVAGGIIGSLAGAWMFRLLQATRPDRYGDRHRLCVDAGSIGCADGGNRSARSVRAARPAAARRARRHHPLVAALPLRTRFYRSGLYISPLAPLLLGFRTGILTILLGIGGGFVLVPAMIYLLGMATQRGGRHQRCSRRCSSPPSRRWCMRRRPRRWISCWPGCCCSDRWPARSSARGFATKVQPEYLRLALAVIVLLVGLRIALGLGWRPDEIFTVELS